MRNPSKPKETRQYKTVKKKIKKWEVSKALKKNKRKRRKEKKKLHADFPQLARRKLNKNSNNIC